MIVTKFLYTILSDGTIDLKTTFQPQGILPELPRLGIAFCLSSDYNTFIWQGRGPQDNYPDRKTSAAVGLWKDRLPTSMCIIPVRKIVEIRKKCVALC